MKLSTTLITISTIFSFSLALEVSVCNFDTINNAFDGNAASILQMDEVSAELLIEDACQKAMKEQIFSFKDITGEGWQFDNNFYDGGTYLNEEYEPETVSFETIYDGQTGPANNRIISYPDDYIEKNFGSCETNAVVCCWVQDRYADGNNNGNCSAEDPEATCKNADPADNTDICGVDLSLAPSSNHVRGSDSTDGAKSFSLFSGDTEGAAHCHGFAWNGEDTTGYRYRGNNLFYVSMYDHLEQRGYVREVPGAPMCGCVEKMPVISRADCTQTDVEESFTVELGGAGNISITLDSIDVTFNACQGATNNDLASYVDTLNFDASTRNLFDEFIVGECDDSKFLSKFGYSVTR